jgi:hypothetical protein
MNAGARTVDLDQRLLIRGFTQLARAFPRRRGARFQLMEINVMVNQKA